MKLKNIMSTCGTVLIIASFTILLMTFKYHWQHPQLAEVAMFKKFWETYLLVALLAIGGHFLIRP